MAVGGMSERLAFILELDADGALSGFRRVGDTAEKELGKADNRLDKLGGRMQMAGAGAIAFAGVAGKALFSFAEQSEDANLAQLKLQNSLNNNPRLAGENASAFTDLADAIQGKTAADGDAIVSGMAMLGTFKVTGDQMREITPLVVDYARKFGVDMVTANASVGKALDGSVGALKRNGVSIDETLFKTDRFRAVTEALASQVGGFAEQEGASFSGRLQRLRNELGDVAEGVGVGAVDAFESMISPVTSVTERLGELNPQLLASAGAGATWGTAAIGAVGATSMLAGTVLRMRERFQEVDPTTGAATGKLNNFGKVAAGLGIAGTVIGLAQMAHAMTGLKVNVEQVNKALADNSAAGQGANRESVRRIMAMEMLDDIVKKVAETDVVAAEKLINLAEAQGYASDKIAEARVITDGKRQADIQGRKNQDEYNESLDAGAGASDDLGDATSDLTAKLKAQKDAIEAVIDATLAQFDSNLGYRKSLDETEGALADLLATQKEHGADSEEYRDALLDAEGALTGQAAAAVKLAEDQAKANGQTLDATEKAKIYRDQLAWLAASLDPSSPLRAQLNGYIADLDRVPAELRTTLLAEAGGAFETVKELLTYLDAIGNHKVIGSSALLKFQQLRNRAAGGDVPPGGTWVGEDGPEILQRDAGGGLKVLDAQRSRSRAGSTGSGGVVLHIDNFNAGGMTPDEAARALLWQWRVAG